MDAPVSLDQEPILAVILAGPSVERAPAVAGLSALVRWYEPHVVLLEGDPGGVPGRVHTLDDLGLPRPSVRFALDAPDLASLVRPFLARHVASLVRAAGAREVVLLDGRCLLLDDTGPLFRTPVGALELVPLLTAPVADTKPGLQAALDAGLGRATSAVLRFPAGDERVQELLAHWADWMWSRYLAGPACSLVEAEVEFLTALPARSPAVGWNHEPVTASWADFHPHAPTPRLVDTEGLADYTRSDGPALHLIERRTHSKAAVDELLGHLTFTPAPPQPRRWSDGEHAAGLAADLARAIDPTGRRWPDPSSVGFRRWLEHVDSAGLPRWARSLYWSRPDLRASFPPTTNVRVFTDWLAGAKVGLLGDRQPEGRDRRVAQRAVIRLARLVRSLAGRREATIASPRDIPAGVVPGVNLVGFARAESGLGEALRGTMSALERLRLPVAVTDVSDRIYSRQRSDLAFDEVGSPYDVTVVHLNPEELLGYAHDSLAHRLGASWVIGYWFWEPDELPQRWLPAFDVVDELWAGSEFLADILERHTGKPVTRIGLPVDVPADVRPDRGRWDLPADAFVVSYVTDAYSGWARKNPLRAIAAFRAAFEARFEEVHLMLKVSNLEKFPAHARALQEATADLPVTVVGEYLTREELWTLLASSDAYLSLHAAEGFGLTIVEAMALGLPVVATAFGGSMDYTTTDCALLVGYDLVPAEGGPADVYSGSGRWARPRIDEAAAHLRRLRDDTALRLRLGEAAHAAAARASPRTHAARVDARLRALGLRHGSLEAGPEAQASE